MNFTEFTSYFLGKDYSDDKGVIASNSDTYSTKLEKILNIVFGVNFIKFYSSKDGLDMYCLWQERFLQKNGKEIGLEDMVVNRYKRIKKIEEEDLPKIEDKLEKEERVLDHEKLEKRKYKLEKEKEELIKEMDILIKWDDDEDPSPFEKVMNIVDKDTIFSAMDHIGPATADLYAFMLKIEAFNRVSKDKDPCEILGQISPNDREELAGKIISAYDEDEYFKKYVDHVIKLKKQESFLPNIESFIGLNCKDNDLYLILFPIMYPYKYMLLRSGYLMLRGVGEYTDEDAHNMLTNNREPYVNLPEALKWKENDTQLSWITKYITASIDSTLEDDVDVKELEEELHKSIEQRLKDE